MLTTTSKNLGRRKRALIDLAELVTVQRRLDATPAIRGDKVLDVASRKRAEVHSTRLELNRLRAQCIRATR